MVIIQEAAFDSHQLLEQFQKDTRRCGAIASFTGIMRDTDAEGTPLQALTIEHYPQMTEKALEKIVQAVKANSHCQKIFIMHRVGRIESNEAIVFVAASASHRRSAFDAVAMVMDFLKNEAPFWKKEIAVNGESRWVEQKASDRDAMNKWLD